MYMRRAVSVAIVLMACTAFAQTKHFQIGTFEYQGNGGYFVNLDASLVTKAPITFGSITFFVQGESQVSSPDPTTGPTCGTVIGAIAPPCRMGMNNLPLCTSSVGVEDCVSIAAQFVSTTGKNFIIPLLDGENFCAERITNVYLTTPANEVALNPLCEIDNPGFCKGVTVPIVLRAATASSCE
jgi:hypothetical protein